MGQFGRRNVGPDSRQQHVLMHQAGVRTTSALDYWDQMVTLHYGGREGLCTHFRAATVAACGLAWAGAPFSVPGTVALANSILTITAGTRSFLFQPMAAANTYDKRASVAPVSNVVGDLAGLRLDDGTDNNYVEVVLCVSQASPTQWVVRTRRRTGGGAVTTQDSDALVADPGYVLAMQLSGTKWSSWGCTPLLNTNMGFGGRMFKPNVALGGANLAFTPTRAGIIFESGAQSETSVTAKADWFDIGRA